MENITVTKLRRALEVFPGFKTQIQYLLETIQQTGRKGQDDGK